MSIYFFHRWLGVIVFLMVSACSATNKSPSLPTVTQQQPKHLSECEQYQQAANTFLKQGESLNSVKRLHRIEEKLLDPSTYSPTGCFDNELDRHIGIEASRLVYLVVAQSPNTHYQTRIVLKCSQLEGLTCRGRSADDTAHTLEFPGAYQPIPMAKSGPLKVKFDPNYALKQMDFYTASDEALHGQGKPIQLQVQTDGTINFRFLDATQQQVLFAIVKGKGDRLYKKYIWVVSRGS